MKKAETEEILLGIDYGSTNIGLAFGRDGSVMPLRVISGKNKYTASDEISRAVIANKVTKIVVGLPLNHEDKETPQALKVREFSKFLKTVLKKPLVFVNEYSSTKESLATSIDLDFSQKRRKAIDHISAAIILRKYYDQLDE